MVKINETKRYDVKSGNDLFFILKETTKKQERIKIYIIMRYNFVHVFLFGIMTTR